MLGLPDGLIVAAWLGSVLAALWCVVFGILNWKKGGEQESQEVVEERRWEAAEEKIEEQL